tara:strand:- start:618 stop:749 length:132 start_codon:yes stop_codon:yes gene_type:complete
MNEENISKEEKDALLKKDFRFGQILYIGIYLTLVIFLIVNAYK